MANVSLISSNIEFTPTDDDATAPAANGSDFQFDQPTLTMTYPFNRAEGAKSHIDRFTILLIPKLVLE